MKFNIVEVKQIGAVWRITVDFQGDLMFVTEALAAVALTPLAPPLATSTALESPTGPPLAMSTVAPLSSIVARGANKGFSDFDPTGARAKAVRDIASAAPTSSIAARRRQASNGSVASAPAAEPAPSVPPGPAPLPVVTDSDLAKACSAGARALGPKVVMDLIASYGVERVNDLADKRWAFIEAIKAKLQPALVNGA